VWPDKRQGQEGYLCVEELELGGADLKVSRRLLALNGRTRELRGCNGRMEQRKGGDFFTLERPEGEGRGAGQLGQEGQGRWWAQDRPGQAVAIDGWRAYA